MSNIEKIQEGATVLQQVDVSDIFTSLAMGIADAQKKLDDNSIAQLTKLADTKLGDKSLLQLGFAPAFYSFTYADINASIHLKMKMKDEFALGVQIKAEYESGKQGKDDYRNIQKENEFNSEKTAYKSTRKFLIKSSSKKAVIINENHYKLNESLAIVSRIDAFHSQIIQSQQIERLNFSVLQQFITHFTPPTVFTILKIVDYADATLINDGTNALTIDTNISDTFPASAKYGFSLNQIYTSAVNQKELCFYFGFDKRIMNFEYAEGSVNNSDKDDEFDALASILREDMDAKILIKGYTDSSGADAYNVNLSKDRCIAMRDWLVAKGARATQINIDPKGESLAKANSGPDDTKNEIFRKVTIEITSGADYFYFDPALSGATPNTGVNYFIINSNSSTEIKSSAEDITNYSNEERNGIDYYLNKNAQIEFSAYSKNSEEINISQEQEEGSEEEIKISQNEKTSDTLANKGGESSSDKTVALGLNVDFRMAKQFEMSVEGNSSMSARMVASPAPEAFIEYVKSLNPPTE